MNLNERHYHPFLMFPRFVIHRSSFCLVQVEGCSIEPCLSLLQAQSQGTTENLWLQPFIPNLRYGRRVYKYKHIIKYMYIFYMYQWMAGWFGKNFPMNKHLWWVPVSFIGPLGLPLSWSRTLPRRCPPRICVSWRRSKHAKVGEAGVNFMDRFAWNGCHCLKAIPWEPITFIFRGYDPYFGV